MSNKIICVFHDTQDHPEDRFHPELPRRQFTHEADGRAALRVLVNSCLNWSMRPTVLERDANKIHHKLEYRPAPRGTGQWVDPKWELVTFTGPRAVMFPLLKLAAHQMVLMDNAIRVPDAPMPPLVLAHILGIPLDSDEFKNVQATCRAEHHTGPDRQQPKIKDMAGHFASLLIGEPEIDAIEAQAEPALSLAS